MLCLKADFRSKEEMAIFVTLIKKEVYDLGLRFEDEFTTSIGISSNGGGGGGSKPYATIHTLYIIKNTEYIVLDRVFDKVLAAFNDMYRALDYEFYNITSITPAKTGDGSIEKNYYGCNRPVKDVCGAGGGTVSTRA